MTQRLIEYTIPGITSPVFLREKSSDYLVLNQVFVEQQYALEDEKEIEWIIDAGAHIGLASLYFARQFPQAKIIAIEANAENYALLDKNTQAFSNIKTLHAALWNQATEMTVLDPGRGPWGYITQEAVFSDSQDHRIQGITVSDIMHEYNIDMLDILKLDIEGAEIEVMEGAEDWIQKVNILMAELHESYRTGCILSFAMNTTSFDQRVDRRETIILRRKSM